MTRGKDWIELVRSTFRSVGREEISGLYAREWRHAREKLTAEDRDEIEREPKRIKRFLKSANAVLFGLSRRLAPARRVAFGAALLMIFLSFNWTWSDHTERTRQGQRRVSEYKVSLDSGFLLASITVLTLLLGMELVDKINYRDELELARELQSSLIPRTLPAPPGFELGAYNRIANMVGGDIYDFVLLPDGRLAVLFGDASGHGMTAGLVMAVAHAAFRTQLETDPAPEAMFATLNRILCRTGGPRAFFGCVYLLVSPDGSFAGSVAGHPPVLRLDVAGDMRERIGKGAYPLGDQDSPLVGSLAGTIEAGETLLLHSDGLTEARDASGAEFGDNAPGFFSSAARPRLPAPDLVASLAADVMAFCGREAPEDDVSIAAVRTPHRVSEREASLPAGTAAPEGRMLCEVVRISSSNRLVMSGAGLPGNDAQDPADRGHPSRRRRDLMDSRCNPEDSLRRNPAICSCSSPSGTESQVPSAALGARTNRAARVPARSPPSAAFDEAQSPPPRRSS